MNLLIRIFGLLLCGLLCESVKTLESDKRPVKKVVARAGTNLTLPCAGVVGEKSVVKIEKLTWKSSQTIIKFINGRPLEQNQRRSLHPKNFSLHFNPVKLIDSGEYICWINDNPSHPIDLLVQDVPEAPSRPMITGFTSRSVNLSWAQVQDPKNAPVTNFILEIRIGESGEWDQLSKLHTNTSNTSHQITGLSPFTIYSFRVLAVNSLGISLPSKESYYIVTLREVPVGKPVMTIAHNTSSNSIYLSWKPPPSDTIFGEFLGYRITYRARDVKPENINEILIRESSVESHEIHDLEIYTQYLISIQVFNPEGLGPATSVVVMTDEGEQ
ncbi:CLUMA_CG001612, isoform A [Clunio marinus]|uniref:CLUMA_CG001612, isoform A n=1 Tax=Clunio marinus TaxID=568069 RepID=A0A1J1HIE6_9DIPT|nr:CLUMA_CG001612, isoform A [Clunio marinus]